MPEMQCPFGGCATAVENADKDIAIALFNAHIAMHTAATARAGSSQKSEKLQRPRIEHGMLEESWNSFKLQWQLYVDGTGITGGESTKQLIHCCEKDLLELVLKVDSGVGSKTVDQVMEVIKKLAVTPVAMGARRADLLAMKQARGEKARIFASNVQGRAATCAFSKDCGKDASLKMFRKLLSNLPKIPPVQLQSNINPLPQRTLFTSTVVRHFDKDVDSITFYSSNKKFYVDIKQSDCPAEKYLKIVELSGGRRATLKVERGDVQELLKTLIKITQNSSNRKQIAFDSNSNKKKFYEVEKGGRSGEGNRWKVLIISENHHDGNKFRVWVPHEVWGHMIHNIGVLYKEHIAGTSSPHDSSLI